MLSLLPSPPLPSSGPNQLAGTYVSFRQLASHHLGCLLAAHPGAAAGLTVEEAADKVLASWAAADLFADVAPALRALHAGGVTLAVLTNGSGEGSLQAG